jgi:hypothetical protein
MLDKAAQVDVGEAVMGLLEHHRPKGAHMLGGALDVAPHEL